MTGVLIKIMISDTYKGDKIKGKILLINHTLNTYLEVLL